MKVPNRNQAGGYSVREILDELEEYCDQSSIEHATNKVTEQAISILGKHNISIEGDAYTSVSQAAQRVLLAEAINLAAKKFDERYYRIKPALFISAAIQGADDGVRIHASEDENGNAVWYIHHEEVGIVSFHDPYGEIAELAELYHEKLCYDDTIEWSGVARTPLAFECLTNESLLDAMVTLTTTSMNSTPRFRIFNGSSESRVVDLASSEHQQEEAYRSQ